MRSIPLVLVLAGCDPAAAGSFPAEDSALADANAAAGDPHRGRFAFESAVEGLPAQGQLRATIVTDAGAVHCELFADVAPMAVANFVGLARGLRPFLDLDGEWRSRHYYDGLVFHRAEPRLFVQGGRLGEQAGIGYWLQDERSIGTAFDGPGVLALANDGPNRSSGEFFITTEVNRSFDGLYTIIGRCSDVLIVRELERRVGEGEKVGIETVVIERE